MFIGQYISTDYHEVLQTDTVEFVLQKMGESHTKFLSVVENHIFYGLISEELLLDQAQTDIPIHHLKLHFKSVYLFDYQHIYDALQLISTYDFCFIPVLNKKHEYMGVLTKQDLLIALNETLGNDEGAIIVLELGIRDNA